MGNMFSCCSNAIPFPEVAHLEEVISFIETPLDAIFIDKPKESTFEAEITNISAGVASSIDYGSCFLENVAGRVKRHSSKIDIQKVVSGTLRGAEQVHWVGAAISVVAYVLDQTDKSYPLSSRKECVEVLRFMCGVVKHIQQRIKRLPEEKLNDLVAFIVKGSFFCMSQMQSTSLSSYFSGLVDGVEINSLQARLITNYEELEPYPDEDDKQKIFDWPKDVVTSNLYELISYIEKYLAKLDKAEEITSESDGIASGRVASSIEYGKHLLRRVWKRCQRHGFKSGETIKVVIDVLKEASQIEWVGAGLTVLAYVLQKVDDASTIKEECLDFLKHMCHLATHIKGLDGQIPQEKLHDVAEFIFEGSFFCLSRIQSSNLSRIFSSVVDSEEMKKLQSKLGQSHQDLTLEALIEALHRMPKALPLSQGEKNLNAVGIDESVLELTKMLAMDDKQDVSSRAVVVYGVGGMGKTCLGNEVFSCLDLKGFKYCHLIIKQDCSEDDLQKLQKQILSDLFGQNSNLRDSDEGHREICKVFREKAREPLFMFIDNALKGSDLAKILPDDLSTMPKRSRMLVTTRKLDETDMLNKPDVITRVAYPINCLPPNEAKKLLSTKALGIPLGTFDASSDIDGLLSACGGIPLVLNLVGTRLCKHRNNLSAFNSTIETFRDSLEKGEDESTEKVVDVVFKSLPGDRYKDAFLDIAAFFSSCKKDIVRYIVREDELKALQEAALVKISDDNVELHDVVLNRGRKLSESDRITDLISLADIIEDTERLEKLKGIRLRGEFHLQAKHLDKMHNCLRVLILGQNEVTGACSREFKNLRYLSIDNENCCSPMELNKLPSLAIFKGRIRSDDCFCNAPPSLRSLTVYGLESVWLHGSFDKLSNLEELSICRKKNYVERLPESFGELRLLRCLHLHHFTELTSLPNTFGQLSKLEELTIRDCPKLSSLSDDFGHLKSLESLAIGFCQSLVKLSDTFAQLNNLKDLTIWDCSSLSSLPNKFGQLKSLQFLKIVRCKSLSSLCEDFGHLRSLKTLTIQKCESLERFNDTIGQLSSLKELIIEDCTMLCSLSDTFGQLNNLRKLIIEKCPMLSGLSDNFGHLKSLEILNIWYCQRLERLSDTFGQLCSLKELYIVNYPSLTSLCDDFGQLKSLQYLRIKDCRSLERLSDTFGQLSNLKELCIKDCESLSSLCDNFGQLSSLQELIISGCQRLERLSDDFGSLTCLTTIDASKCPVLEGKAVEQMTGLTSLMELDIRKSPLLIECWQKIEDGHPQNVLTGRKRDIMLKSNPVDINAARDQVIKLLALRNKSDTRAVVLSGVGGIGKTTLAIAVISSLKLDAYKYRRINIQWDNCSQSDCSYMEAYYMSSPKPIFLFIDNVLSGRELHKILPGNLPSLPKGSRMLITTRRLDETRVIEQRGIKRYPYKIDGLSEEGSEKLLCRKALGSADKCFNGSFDIDSLAKICGGIPPVLNMAGSKLRELGNDVSACDRTIEFLRDTLSKVEGDWREKVVDVLYNGLRENMYKNAFLDIAAFFNNWRERTVGYIVGEAALKAIEDAALVQISEQGKVIVDCNVQVRGRELSELEEGRITNTESLQSALKDTERLEKTQGICLLRKSSKGLLSFPRMSSFNDAEIHLQAAHLDKMHECLRVLILCKGTKVTGECAQKFDNLRYLKVNNGDCSPIELNKLPSLAIFEGRLRGDDRFCDLPHSLRRLKVDALESLGFDENFGKLSRLEELNLSQNEQYLTRLPQSFGQLDSLRYLKLSHFRELTSLPDTFGQLRNLEELHINDCTKLCSLSDNFGKLSKLNRLKIINCPNLLNLSDGFSQLTNLKNLVIVNCTNLASLSHSFGQLSNLKKLVIVNCTNLSTLCDNFGQLKSLEYLRIRGCRRLERLSEDFGSLPCVAAIDASGCAVLEGNTVNQMIELKSLKVLNICESQLLLKRWEEVKDNHPLLVRTESERDIFFRNSMCRALFDAENRFLNVDGMVREWSPTFVEGESQGVAFLVSCCDLCSPSNKKACQMVLKKMAQFSSWVTSHIIYVGLTEQNGERTGETLRHLSQGINSGATLCAWIPSHYKWKELFGFSACMMLSSTWRLNTFVALGILSTSEQGNPRVQAIMQIIPRVEDEDSDEDMALNVPYMDTEEDEDEKVEDEDDEDGDDEIAMVDLGADFSSLYSHLHTSFAF